MQTHQRVSFADFILLHEGDDPVRLLLSRDKLRDLHPDIDIIAVILEHGKLIANRCGTNTKLVILGQRTRPYGKRTRNIFLYERCQNALASIR